MERLMDVEITWHATIIEEIEGGRLATAREEERRRLWRDLHDGLGPQLASLTLGLDAARNLLTIEPEEAEAMLVKLKAHTQDAISDLRRLVYDLRPPALDELGLVSAIRQQVAKYCLHDGSNREASNSNELAFSVEAPDLIPPLPEAVEVTCYRIAQEAITNVVRHANAHTCCVCLSVGDELELEIVDDGVGLSNNRNAGVGQASMNERAAELGGTCVVEPVLTGGTRVLARLPLPVQEVG